MMSFEGIDKVREQISEGQTLYRLVQEMGARLQQTQAELQQARVLLSRWSGIPDAGRSAAQPRGGGQAGSTALYHGGSRTGTGGGQSRTIQSGEAAAQTPRTPYMDALAARSRPNMNVGGGV